MIKHVDIGALEYYKAIPPKVVQWTLSETASKPSDEIKCTLCEFTAKNKFGLKIHFHKKHSTAKFKCFACDFTCESHDDLIPHNDKYYYSHRQSLNKNYEKHILDEI